MFGSLGQPRNQPSTPPYVPSSTLPGGLPPGAVTTPPPGAVILGPNGQPINPGQPAPLAMAPPAQPQGPIISNPAPAPGPSTPLPPGGYPFNPSTPGAGAFPPAVTTNPPPSATGPINSQSRRFSNEELQNSVRLGTPQVVDSKANDPLSPPPAPATGTPGSGSQEPPLAANTPGTPPSSPPASGSGSPRPSATATPSPLDIPRFLSIRNGVAVGRQPFPDGIVWLKDAGYRRVIHLAGPAEVDEAARKLFEREGIAYSRLELDPATMDRAGLLKFAEQLKSNANQPVFLFDRDGTRLGAVWFANRVIEEKADQTTAKFEAEQIGFAWDRLPEQDPVKQNLAKLLIGS